MQSKETNPTDARTFPEIWASLTTDEREELHYQLMKSRCTTTRQTVWNWASGKKRPFSVLISNEIAKCVTKVTGKRVIAATLFPSK